MSMYKNLMTVCCAAVLALGLAACGGGGSSPTASGGGGGGGGGGGMSEPQAVSSALELTEDQQAAFKAELASAGATDSVTIPAGGSVERAGVMLTCNSAYPCTVTITNNLGTIVATMSTQKLPDAAAPTITAAYTPPPGPPTQPSSASQRRSNTLANLLSRLVPGDANNDGAVAEGEVVWADHDTSHRPAYLGRAADATATPPVTAINLLDRITPAGIDHDGDDETALIPADPHDGSIADGWMGATFRHDLPGGATDITVVFTDKEADKTETFAEAYGGLGPASTGDATGTTIAEIINNLVSGDGNARPADLPASTTQLQRDAYAQALATFMMTVRTVDFTGAVKPGSGKYNGAPMVADDAASRAQFWMLASSPNGFPAKPVSGTDTSRDYFGPGNDPANASLADSDSDGSVTDEAGYNPNGEMVAGTFDGVPGNFECRFAAGCTVRHSATEGLSSHQQGAAISTIAEWQFIATSSATTVATTRPDGDFVKMGWWQHRPQFSTGTHRFATFYTGRDPFNWTDTLIAGLEGDAEYEGPAAGRYAMITRVGNEFPAVDGFFVATASLTAEFGDGTETGTIAGTVSDFEDRVDGRNLSGWHVVLGSAPLASLTEAAPSVMGSTVDENSRANGRHFTSGMWQGQFYGNNDDSGYPGTVAGKFDARWGAPGAPGGFVSIAGTFGADYVPPPADE